MSVLQAFLLGIVQGLTEFLPISSSGHLLIVQKLFGLGVSDSLLTFDIVIHLGTLVAILLFFGRTLFKVTWKEWILVVVGTIPAGLVGLLFKDQLELLFGGDGLVGMELIITGMIVLWTEWYIEKHVALEAKQPESVSEVASKWSLRVGNNTPIKTLLIGIAQAVAIIPGISRSGSTVAGAIGMGLSREEAFRFSFLLAIPAIAGAGVLELKDAAQMGTLATLVSLPYLVGAFTAMVTGIASLKLFKYVIDQARLAWFGWYCVILGSLVTVWFFLY